jgi:5-methylcytosine-specific restriction protein A
MAGVCSTPRCPEFATGLGKCDEHRSQSNRKYHRTTPTKVARTSAVAKRRRDAVKAHRQQHGDWCPGWNKPGHKATDLTADDPVPIAHGGDPMQPLRVLCRSCNGARGAREAAPGG